MDVAESQSTNYQMTDRSGKELSMARAQQGSEIGSMKSIETLKW